MLEAASGARFSVTLQTQGGRDETEADMKLFLLPPVRESCSAVVPEPPISVTAACKTGGSVNVISVSASCADVEAISSFPQRCDREAGESFVCSSLNRLN